jgi:hypothetical protein
MLLRLSTDKSLLIEGQELFFDKGAMELMKEICCV